MNQPFLTESDVREMEPYEISEEIDTKLRQYAELLGRANERARLTGPSDPIVLYDEHIADALAALPYLPENGAGKRFVDVGTGGGLPGLVWGICRPDMSGALLDSIGRKSTLVAEIARELGCDNVAVVGMRSEDFANAKGNRESFDVATARAVAHACVLAEYLSPLVKVGGRVIAFKGKSVLNELDIRQAKWHELGLAAPTLHPYTVAGKERCLVIWEKIKPCPALYPRKPGMAEKKPWCGVNLPGNPRTSPES